MNAPLMERFVTADEFLTLPDGDRYELLDGRLVEKTMGAQSSAAAIRLGGLLEPHVRSQNLGWVLGSDGGYQLFPDRPNRVRMPDASFIRRGRLPEDELPEGHIRTFPDLACEAVSPNDLALEVEDTIDEYLRTGVALVWVIFPRTHVVMVYRADGSVSRLRAADELNGENVVPGFKSRVAELFAGPSS